jgi:hypothetical protein
MKDMRILRNVFYTRCANPSKKFMEIINTLNKSKEIVV